MVYDGSCNHQPFLSLLPPCLTVINYFISIDTGNVMGKKKKILTVFSANGSLCVCNRCWLMTASHCKADIKRIIALHEHVHVDYKQLGYPLPFKIMYHNCNTDLKKI